MRLPKDESAGLAPWRKHPVPSCFGKTGFCHVFDPVALKKPRPKKRGPFSPPWFFALETVADPDLETVGSHSMCPPMWFQMFQWAILRHATWSILSSRILSSTAKERCSSHIRRIWREVATASRGFPTKPLELPRSTISRELGTSSWTRPGQVQVDNKHQKPHVFSKP